MLKIYSYVVDHDFGLAPNPFGRYCTLAVCKGSIRSSSNLNTGDWIIGTGSRALEHVSGNKYISKLIYAMQVDEILSLEDYWADDRFDYKKPVLNGSLITMYGDNFYHKDEKGNWIQENSAHSLSNGNPNQAHIKKDTRGARALISENFYYFGDQAPVIPKTLKGACHSGVGQKIVNERLNADLINWIKTGFNPGIYGDPVNWVTYKQTQINL